MNSAVCTLFEGHYHFGLAALTNSLYHQGYRGAIYAGYRGDLPEWAIPAKENNSLNWPGATTYEAAPDLILHFLPLNTEYHLTNYKPDFMINLWDGPARGSKNMFFFDPDIVITSEWSFLEEWLGGCGVSLCEDINSPLGENHPRRIAWRNYFGSRGINLLFKDSIYANGGFLGVNKENEKFLILWKEIQETMAPAIGGLNRSAISGNKVADEARKPYAPFMKTDQDALNATVEAWNGKVSFIGHEGMDFKPGESLMPHAIGPHKPWQINPLLQIMRGFPPRRVEKEYWNFANGVILPHSKSRVSRRKVYLKIAAFISRFYKR